MRSRRHADERRTPAAAVARAGRCSRSPSSSSGCSPARLGEAWASLRAFVGLLPRTPALFARRSAVARLAPGRRRRDPRPAEPRQRPAHVVPAGQRHRDLHRHRRRRAPLAGELSSARRSPGSSWSSGSSRRQPHDDRHRGPDHRRVPAAARPAPATGGRTSRRGGAPAGSARRRPTRPGGACSRRQRAVAGPDGPRPDGARRRARPARGLGHLAAGDGVPVQPGPHRGPARLRRAARSCPASSRRVASRRSSPTPSSRGSSTCCASAVGIGTADPAAEAQDDLATASRPAPPRAHPAHRARWPSPRRSPWRSRRPCCPWWWSSPCVLGLTSLAVGAGGGPPPGSRVSGWPRRGWRGLLNLPWSPTWSWDDLAAPAARRRPRPRRSPTSASMAIGSGRLEVLALALYVPVLVALAVGAGVAPDVGRPGRRARSSCSSPLAVLQDRDDLPFARARRRRPAGAGRAGPGAGGGVGRRRVRRGRRRPHVRLAPARSPCSAIGAVAVGAVPGALRRSPTAPGSPRSTRSARQTPCRVVGSSRRQPTVGDYRVLYLGDPRLIPFPSTDLGDGVAMALVDNGAADLRDRWAVVDQSADGPLQAAIEEIATTRTLRGPAGCSPRSASATSSCRSSTAPTRPRRTPLPLPAGLLDALGGQLDLVRVDQPADFARFENSAVIPTTASLAGDARGGLGGEDLDALVAVDTARRDADVRRRRHDRRAAADVAAPASSTSPRPSTGLARCRRRRRGRAPRRASA